jgi:transposase
MARRIKAKLILQLRASGLSRNAIASAQKMAKQSVFAVFDAADALGVTYDDIAGKDDGEVYRLLFPGRNNHVSVFAEPDWERVHKELARTGVTLKLLHHEYADRCRCESAVSMSYDRFCKSYQTFTVKHSVTSRVGHKAGRICEVDWSGPTMAVVDPQTGEIETVYLFVGTLPFSRYSYVEPTLDMKQDTWLRCHIHMFEFFGGSTPCLIPDNLKTGVVKHPKEGEVVLNDAYREATAHYSCAILPGRVRKPKDKPSVENTVGNIATAIIARLRNATFTSFGELKVAVADALVDYNAEPFQKREGGSRLLAFEDGERQLLRPLPERSYEICRWAYGRKVQLNCHVVWARNYYSVSHLHVGAHVDLRITDTTIEIFRDDERIATHMLFAPYMANRYSTIEAHLPKEKRYGDWDAQRIRDWALRIGPACVGVVERIFQSVKFDEQGFNAALAVLRLSKKYSAERVERACDIALSSGIRSPRYAHIGPILETNQDKMDADTKIAADSGYIRGAEYYGRA